MADRPNLSDGLDAWARKNKCMLCCFAFYQQESAEGSSNFILICLSFWCVLDLLDQTVQTRKDWKGSERIERIQHHRASSALKAMRISQLLQTKSKADIIWACSAPWQKALEGPGQCEWRDMQSWIHSGDVGCTLEEIFWVLRLCFSRRSLCVWKHLKAA